jgi:hypothetical protein
MVDSLLNKSNLIQPKSQLHHAILPLLYFEIFKYPLTFQEVNTFSYNAATSTEDLENALRFLVQNGLIFQYEGYYLSQNCPEWVQQRKENQERAIHFMKKAKKMTRLIAAFPFVRGVFISGSLSKDIMQKDGDIDYFIITQPGRLWIACSLLILFKKICLFNSRKYFCVNYFVDENHLEIEEKNRFTAIEIATILPLTSPKLYLQFLKANQWAKEYFPKQKPRPIHGINPPSKNIIKRGLETLLNLKIFDHLDHFLMQLTIRFWEKKYNHVPSNKNISALKSKPYVSKRHPNDFQEKIRLAYEANITNFEKKNGLKIERSNEWRIK